jgi:ribosomal protein S18 acetylase RimI-like enzyme
VRAKRCDGKTGRTGSKDNPRTVSGVIACKADRNLVRGPHQGQQSMPTAQTGRTDDCTRPNARSSFYACNAGAIHRRLSGCDNNCRHHPPFYIDCRVEPSVKSPFQIKPLRTGEELQAVRNLFTAYADTLPVNLDYQQFDSELRDLPGKYAPPNGELLIAWDMEGRPSACVALRPLNDERYCEMKRLYVLPQARSFGLGETLAKAIIVAAKARGYSALRLDTLSTMNTATSLYERMGFHRIAPYYGPTPVGTIFMELDLSR